MSKGVDRIPDMLEEVFHGIREISHANMACKAESELRRKGGEN